MTISHESHGQPIPPMDGGPDEATPPTDPESSGSVDDAELFEPIRDESTPSSKMRTVTRSIRQPVAEGVDDDAFLGQAASASASSGGSGDTSRDSTALVLAQGYPEVDAVDGTDDSRPWMVCVVDEPTTKRMVEELKGLLRDRLRIFVASTVQGADKHLQVAKENDQPVAVVMSEEPFAGMVGGGFWALQKCRSQAPDAVRLLAVERYDSLVALGLAKLRESDVHQVLDASTPATDVAMRLILPLLAAPDDSLDETLRSATIRAKSDVRVLQIPKETFADLLRRDAQLSIGITRELARRLRKIQNQ